MNREQIYQLKKEEEFSRGLRKEHFIRLTPEVLDQGIDEVWGNHVFIGGAPYVPRVSIDDEVMLNAGWSKNILAIPTGGCTHHLP
jgi:hypothetical protein